MATAFTIFRVKLGWMALVGEGGKAERIFLPESSREELRHHVLAEFPGLAEKRDLLGRAKRELAEYFAGKRTRFSVSLDLSKATSFQQKVYAVLSTIPFGEVRSYRWLAAQVGDSKALRAVGAANGKNRWPPIVPCHRVVGSDGRLTGFSAPGGLELKARMLALEGVQVKENRVHLH